MTWRRCGDAAGWFIRDRAPSHAVLQLIIIQGSPFPERVKYVMSHNCCKIAIHSLAG